MNKTVTVFIRDAVVKGLRGLAANEQVSLPEGLRILPKVYEQGQLALTVAEAGPALLRTGGAALLRVGSGKGTLGKLRLPVRSRLLKLGVPHTFIVRAEDPVALQKPAVIFIAVDIKRTAGDIVFAIVETPEGEYLIVQLNAQSAQAAILNSCELSTAPEQISFVECLEPLRIHVLKNLTMMTQHLTYEATDKLEAVEDKSPGELVVRHVLLKIAEKFLIRPRTPIYHPIGPNNAPYAADLERISKDLDLDLHTVSEDDHTFFDATTHCEKPLRTLEDGDYTFLLASGGHDLKVYLAHAEVDRAHDTRELQIVRRYYARIGGESVAAKVAQALQGKIEPRHLGNYATVLSRMAEGFGDDSWAPQWKALPETLRTELSRHLDLARGILDQELGFLHVATTHMKRYLDEKKGNIRFGYFAGGGGDSPVRLARLKRALEKSHLQTRSLVGGVPVGADIPIHVPDDPRFAQIRGLVARWKLESFPQPALRVTSRHLGVNFAVLRCGVEDLRPSPDHFWSADLLWRDLQFKYVDVSKGDVVLGFESAGLVFETARARRQCEGVTTAGFKPESLVKWDATLDHFFPIGNRNFEGKLAIYPSSGRFE